MEFVGKKKILRTKLRIVGVLVDFAEGKNGNGMKIGCAGIQIGNAQKWKVFVILMKEFVFYVQKLVKNNGIKKLALNNPVNLKEEFMNFVLKTLLKVFLIA